MDKIDISAPFAGERRDRFFARSVGTSFDAKTDGNATTIDLYDEIGWYGVSAKGFRSRLKEATGDLVLRVNSGGGDVFDGIAIHNDILAYDGKVRVEIVGIAASIASIIAMAGDEIVMAPNAMMMIHDAWTIGAGNRHDFGEIAGVLSKIDDALARTYASRSNMGIREIKRAMDAETWFTAKEAVDAGFATAIAEAADSGAKAKFDLSVFSNVPKALVWDVETDNDDDAAPTKRDIERALTRDAGWSRSKARAAMRDAEQSSPVPTQDAGGEDLKSISEALKELRSALLPTTP